MSSAERNEQLLRSGIEATNRGDLETVMSMLDPEVECHVQPGLGNPGTWRGPRGYLEMATAWNEAFTEIDNTVVAVETPREHHVIAEVHQTAVGAVSGAPVEMTIFYMFEVHGERATRLHVYGDREAALAAI
jgi:ketosteroid isomerase-like protein